MWPIPSVRPPRRSDRAAGTIRRQHSYSQDPECDGVRVDFCSRTKETERTMNGIIYLIGLIVVVLAILSFLGLG